MSPYVIAAPEALVAASTDLTGLGSAIRAANTAAATSTAGIAVAAGDEVSAAIATLFGTYARDYQALSAQTALFQEQFVQALTGAGSVYAAAEAANASPLQAVEQDILGVINAPTNLLLGRPLIGNGTTGAAGTGHAGGAGGILWGNGGNGGSGGVPAAPRGCSVMVAMAALAGPGWRARWANPEAPVAPVARAVSARPEVGAVPAAPDPAPAPAATAPVAREAARVTVPSAPPAVPAVPAVPAAPEVPAPRRSSRGRARLGKSSRRRN